MSILNYPLINKLLFNLISFQLLLLLFEYSSSDGLMVMEKRTKLITPPKEKHLLITLHWIAIAWNQSLGRKISSKNHRQFANFSIKMQLHRNFIAERQTKGKTNKCLNNFYSHSSSICKHTSIGKCHPVTARAQRRRRRINCIMHKGRDEKRLHLQLKKLLLFFTFINLRVFEEKLPLKSAFAHKSPKHAPSPNSCLYRRIQSRNQPPPTTLINNCRATNKK